MKPILCLLLLVFVATNSLFAATITGVVKDAKTNKAVAGQQVRVVNATWTYVDFAVTDQNGEYSLPISSTITVGTALTVYANACNRSYTQLITYTGVDEIINFSLCPGGDSYELQGFFKFGASWGTKGAATVFLISETVDVSTGDTSLTVIDSFPASYSVSANFARRYTQIPAGTLYLKVALGSSHPQYGRYLPTYADSSLRWSGATPLTNRSFISDTIIVAMCAGVNPGGPAFLGGSVKEGANKPSGLGDPIEGRILILTTSDGTAVAHTWSDASGHFSISNLAYGTYLLFGDVLGKQNPELTVTLSPEQPGVMDIIFDENDQSFRGRIEGLGLETRKLSDLSISPNPAHDIIQINGLQQLDGDKFVKIWNALGTQVLCKPIRKGEPGSLNIADLPPGIYTLQVAAEAGSTNFKIIK